MIPFSVLTSKTAGLPVIHADATHKQETTFPLSGGMQLSESNEMALKRAQLCLVTTRELRAAHIFLYKNDTVKWHLFEPSDQPLNQAEINGHMMFAMQSMKEGELTAFQIIENLPKKHMRTKPVIEFLNRIGDSERIYVVFVFRDMVFTTGNYFDESTMCQTIMNFVPSVAREKAEWPDADPRLRMFRKQDLNDTGFYSRISNPVKRGAL